MCHILINMLHIEKPVPLYKPLKKEEYIKNFTVFLVSHKQQVQEHLLMQAI